MKWREIGSYLTGALAPARWTDELEKPDPGFRRRGLAGWFKVSCCWVGPCFAPGNSS